MKSSTHPTWFGPQDQPLFGVAHLPVGHARGAVILCPPLGKEHINTYRGVKMLAQELADRGFVALRFDYYGVGDSSGSQNADDIVERWLDSIDEAVSWVRGIGVTEVALVGLRAGSLLAERAAARAASLAAVVLWDPIATGRLYVREQQAFYALGVGGENELAPEDEVPMIGLSLTKPAAAAFSALAMSVDADSVRHWMFVNREGEYNKRIAGLIQKSGATVTTAKGMDEFVTPESFLVAIPEAAIDTITTWLDEVMPTETSPITPSFETRTVITGAESGVAVVETIESLGPQGVFAIRTSPASPAEPSGKTLLLCATANDTRIGPSRIWVELARETAELGAESLRFDRRGTGESDDVVRSEHTPIYSDESMDDVDVATRAVASDPKDFIAAGICSGSWYAAYAARELGAGSVVLINAVAWSWRRKRSAQGKIVPADMGVPRTDPEWQRTPRARVKAALQRHLPYWAWKLLGVRGITQVPEVILGSLAKQGIDQTVVLAPADLQWFVDQRGNEGLERMNHLPSTPQLITPPVGDHSGYHRAVRDAVSEHVLGTLLGGTTARGVDARSRS